VQLLNKTNQFNTTMRRYSAEAFGAFTAAPGAAALQFRLLDRFGDNGLVSVLLLAPAPDEEHTLAVENWVMSCRVFGRQLEDEALNIAVEHAHQAGARQLRADYIPTAKNGVIADLFARLGFRAAASPPEAGVQRWQLDCAAYRRRPTFIQREPQT
jgi:FkbH-like protein